MVLLGEITAQQWVAAAIALVATFVVARMARWAVERFVGRFDEHKGAGRAWGIGVQLFSWFVGLEVALHMLGMRLTTLFAAGGLFALGAGFAIKNIVENFLSGGILRMEKTIREGDLIIVDDKWVTVQRLGMRTITAVTYDGEEILIPNSLIAQSTVVNLTRGSRLHRIQVHVGVAYESDLRQVRETLEGTVENLEWRSQAKRPKVYLHEFADSAVTYHINVWIDDANDARQRSSDLREAVWWALKDKNITIAYPQLDVRLDKKD